MPNWFWTHIQKQFNGKNDISAMVLEQLDILKGKKYLTLISYILQKTNFSYLVLNASLFSFLPCCLPYFSFLPCFFLSSRLFLQHSFLSPFSLFSYLPPIYPLSLCFIVYFSFPLLFSWLPLKTIWRHFQMKHYAK